MKKFIAVFAGLLAAGAFALAATAPTAPIKLTAKNGDVTFNHKTHADAKCADCHHADADKPAACTTCHGKDPKAPKVFDAFHKGEHSCKPCHEKAIAAGKKAPKACGDCHKK